MADIAGYGCLIKRKIKAMRVELWPVYGVIRFNKRNLIININKNKSKLMTTILEININDSKWQANN